MKGIFSFYTKYAEHLDEYNNRLNGRFNYGVKNSYPLDNEQLKQKAKVIAEPILILDNYEHEKAEDSESFFLTYNIELMSVAGLLASLPVAVTKILPFLNKYADKNKTLQKMSKKLNSYANAQFKFAGKNLRLPKVLSLAGLAVGAIFYAHGIKKSMQSQLGVIRKASFDATQNIINNPKMFAILSPAQQKTLESELKYENSNKSAFVDKLKDKVDIKSSLSSVSEYTVNKTQYKKDKEEYFKNLKSDLPDKFSKKQNLDAYSDKVLLESYLKNVEHAVLEPLRRVETIANISYSSLFTGGFLEYLITDKLVDVLGVKNKILRCAMKIGVPLVTYFILNKNISDIENKAILATKFKYLKKFTENPLAEAKETKKQPLPEFLKTVYQDMKDYDKFEREELPIIKEKQEIKKCIGITPIQLKDAKRLQRNTSMVLNKQREKLYEQSVGIKALSETILGPIDIVATAVGGMIGHGLSKKTSNTHLAKIMTGLGAVVAFIPAAIIEAKLTKQQKMSEKIASMLAIDDVQEVNQFIDISSHDDFAELKMPKTDSAVFKDITAKLV